MNICRNSNIEVRKNGDEVTLSVIGDFNSTTTPFIHECCKKVEQAGDIRTIVLDFERAGSVDTTAFACIITFIKEHIGSDCRICVRNLRDLEKRLLEILKIEKIIKIV